MNGGRWLAQREGSIPEKVDNFLFDGFVLQGKNNAGQVQVLQDAVAVLMFSFFNSS